MYALQRSLQYRPDAREVAPSEVWLPQVQALRLATADGERLVAWWSPPRDERAPVVLYLHGNGANLAARDRRFAWLIARGAGLLAVSWRGYGGSTGTPTEAGLREDTRAAWQALTAAPGAGRVAIEPAGAGPAAPIAPPRIVVFGESLGTTLAVMLAAEVAPRAVVLDSGFSSALHVAQASYPWLPVAWLMKDPLRADLAAPRVQAPVLQVHCRDDPVTPRAAAERLHALLPRAEPIVTVDDRCHTPSLRRWEQALEAFLARHAGP